MSGDYYAEKEYMYIGSMPSWHSTMFLFATQADVIDSKTWGLVLKNSSQATQN